MLPSSHLNNLNSSTSHAPSQAPGLRRTTSQLKQLSLPSRSQDLNGRASLFHNCGRPQWASRATSALAATSSPSLTHLLKTCGVDTVDSNHQFDRQQTTDSSDSSPCQHHITRDDPHTSNTDQKATPQSSWTKSSPSISPQTNTAPIDATPATHQIPPGPIQSWAISPTQKNSIPGSAIINALPRLGPTKRILDGAAITHQTHNSQPYRHTKVDATALFAARQQPKQTSVSTSAHRSTTQPQISPSRKGNTITQVLGDNTTNQTTWRLGKGTQSPKYLASRQHTNQLRRFGKRTSFLKYSASPIFKLSHRKLQFNSSHRNFNSISQFRFR